MSNQTGPTTTAGKASSCLNHLRHGAASESLFIKDEDPKEYLALLENAFLQHQPSFDQDAALVADSVHARWILNRRLRVSDQYDAAVYERKPDGKYFVPVDLKELDLIDRYVTQAEHRLARALKSLQLVKKIAHDEQRWQFQLESQKQKLAIYIERFELAKQKKQQQKVEPPHCSAAPPPQAQAIEQTLYIGSKNNTTIIHEVTPLNEAIRRGNTGSLPVSRTYNFVGSVPAEYQHLITADAITWGKSTSVRKLYSWPEWQTLTASE